jgi:hypothetical protein
MSEQPTPESTSPTRPRRRRTATPSPSAPPAIAPAVAESISAAPAPAPVEPASKDSQRAGAVAAQATGSLDRLAVERLEFTRGAIGGVRATDVAARMAVVGGVAASQVSVEVGFVNGIAAREATVQRGVVRGVLARDAHFEQAVVRSVVANTVHAGPNTGILFAVARQIDGEARVLMDWRGALAFGTALGAFFALVRLARR